VPGPADPAAAATYVTHSRQRSIKFAATPPPPHAPSVFAQASLNDRRRRRRRPSLSSRAGGGTGVNAAGDAGDTSPQYFGWGDVNGNIPPILLRTFGYSRPLLVALRSLSLKPISFGYKTPPIRFSQAGGQSRLVPPNLELALTPLGLRRIGHA